MAREGIVVDTVRMKRPDFAVDDEELVTGSVARDDRGNAIWQWKDESILDQQLSNPKLSIREEEPPPGVNVGINATGARVGFNPYGTGVVVKTERPRRKDLRQLSKWIEMRKRLPPQED